MASGLLPSLATANPKAKLRRLQPGDKIGLIAPASAVSPRQIEVGLHNMRGMGLDPQLGQSVREVHGYLAGTDEQRAGDINAMFADPEINAVFAISGGWGCARLLPLLDWDLIRGNPKLLIGYSDITALHCAFAARAGFPTIHAPNAANRWDVASWNSFWWLAFAGLAPLLGRPSEETQVGRAARTVSAGHAKGRLLGGNLTVISTLMGTPWMPDMDGAILFLEDVGEAPYRIDRMLQQLSLAGVLDRLDGIIFGQCTRCDPPGEEGLGFQLDEILDHHLAPLAIPAVSGANIGHVGNQISLPVGAEIELDADARTIRVAKAIVT